MPYLDKLDTRVLCVLGKLCHHIIHLLALWGPASWEMHHYQLTVIDKKYKWVCKTHKSYSKACASQQWLSSLQVHLIPYTPLYHYPHYTISNHVLQYHTTQPCTSLNLTHPNHKLKHSSGVITSLQAHREYLYYINII